MTRSALIEKDNAKEDNKLEEWRKATTLMRRTTSRRRMPRRMRTPSRTRRAALLILTFGFQRILHEESF